MGLVILFTTAALLLLAITTLGVIHNIQHPTRKSYGWALAKQLPTSPAELNLDYEEKSVSLADNSHTPAWIITGRQPNRPVILFAHGWSSSRYQSLPRAAILAQHASKVILFDQRGQGDAAAPKCTLGCKEPADLLAVLRQLDHILTPDDLTRPLVLFGSSMGAAVAIEAAVRAQKSNDYPMQPAALIAEGPYRFPMNTIARQLWRRSILPYPTATLAWWHIRFWNTGLKPFDTAKIAARLKIPLLIIHGQNDPISPVTEAQQIANAAPRSQIEVFPNAGHGHLAEDDPQRYRDTINHWLKKIPNIG